MEIWNYIGETVIFLSMMGAAILIVIFPFIRKMRNRRRIKTVTSLKRGTESERKLILRLLKKGIPAQTIFHDLFIEKGNETSSQIDIVVATTEGILVIEVKDLSGWILGNGNHSHWTQVLAYGKKKYRFYNPIKQNKNHITVIRKQLRQFEKIPFYSIIVFYGKCELKEINYVPEGTYLVKPHRIFEVLKLIKKNNRPAPYTNKKEIVRILKQAVLQGANKNNQKKHVENIKAMLGKDRIFD